MIASSAVVFVVLVGDFIWAGAVPENTNRIFAGDQKAYGEK